MLVEQAAQREIVAATCAQATAAGVRCGMTLAEARALCPGLVRSAFDPAGDERALEALARWMTRYSPVVAPELPDGIFLDIAGCVRLYRGVDPLVRQVRAGLARMQITARLAVAPTPGAAWAVASCGVDGTILEGEVDAALSPLPVAALRLEAQTVALLEHLGVRTLAELLRLPRRALPARFGTQVLQRLDAALGRIAEPLVAVDYPITVAAQMEFEGAVESLEVLELAVRHLVEEVSDQLQAHGLGARQVRVTFRQAYAPAVVKEVRLGRATRQVKTIVKLLGCVIEGIEGEGFVGVRLDVPDFQHLVEGQWEMFDQEEQAGEEEVSRLVELLQARFGQRAMGRVELVESHLPERAFRIAAEEVPPARTSVASLEPLLSARPLEVLPVPVEVRVVVSPSADGEGLPIALTHEGEVHRLAHADGPERIDGIWWEGHDKTRDYYDVEDQRGNRFWIFRVVQSGRWFLHGVFA